MEEFFQQWQFPQFELYWDPQWFLQLDVILFGLAAVLLVVLVFVLSFTKANLADVPPEKQYFLVKWKWFLSSTPNQGHFIARKWQQGIWARPYGPGWHFIFLINLLGDIDSRKLFDVVDLSPDPNDDNIFGLIRAKDGAPLPAGQIMTERYFTVGEILDGEYPLRHDMEIGFQLELLSPGAIVINPELFEVTLVVPRKILPIDWPHPITKEIMPWPQIGIITMKIGREVPEDLELLVAPKPGANPDFPSHKNFTDLHAFLAMGGYRGVQEEIAEPGSYPWNPAAVDIKEQRATFVPEGQVGVVINSTGALPGDDDLEEIGLMINGRVVHPGTVPAGQDKEEKIFILAPGKEHFRGILNRSLVPGFHFINPVAKQVRLVDVTPRNIRWDGLPGNGGPEFKPIPATTKDGYRISLIVEAGYQISPKNAPRMVALAGDQRQLELEILKTQGQGLLLDIVSENNLGDFFSGREAIEKAVLKKLEEELEKYYVDIQFFRVVEIAYGREAEEFIRQLTRATNTVQERIAILAETETARANVELQRQNALAGLQAIVADAELRGQAVANIAEAIKTKSEALGEAVRGLAGEGGLVKSIQLFLSDPAALTKIIEALPGLAGMFPGIGRPKQLGSGDQSADQTPPSDQSNSPRR